MSRRVWWNDGMQQVLQIAVVAHRDQVRRGSDVPYIVHPLMVARIVEEAGFDEITVAAALLHDVIEDTPITLNELGMRCDGNIASIVAACTEIKTDPQGQPIPWEDRKREHLQRLRRSARTEVRAVMLADKLDNLRSIKRHLRAGQPVWENFHATRDRVLWYYETMINTCKSGDPRLRNLARDCSWEFDRVRAFPFENSELTERTT